MRLCNARYVTCNAINVTCYVLNVTCNAINVTCNARNVTCNAINVTCYVFYVTCNALKRYLYTTLATFSNRGPQERSSGFFVFAICPPVDFASDFWFSTSNIQIVLAAINRINTVYIFIGNIIILYLSGSVQSKFFL